MLHTCTGKIKRLIIDPVFAPSPTTHSRAAAGPRLAATAYSMARRLIPLLDRVLIEKIVAPTKSAGGVLLPESALPKVIAICVRCCHTLLPCTVTTTRLT
jgi:Chaperonin 10 Kd subunit